MKKFALAGNPNCGKTTLFNSLTGSTAHVGNWPGVTVDKREGTYKKCAEPVSIVDLPGIYSLSPYTPEEVISVFPCAFCSYIAAVPSPLTTRKGTPSSLPSSLT